VRKLSVARHRAFNERSELQKIKWAGS